MVLAGSRGLRATFLLIYAVSPRGQLWRYVPHLLDLLAHGEAPVGSEWNDEVNRVLIRGTRRARLAS